jgi:hypothetical protein
LAAIFSVLLYKVIDKEKNEEQLPVPFPKKRLGAAAFVRTVEECAGACQELHPSTRVMPKLHLSGGVASDAPKHVLADV